MDNRCRLCAEPYQVNIDILENTQFLSLIDYFFQLKLSADDKLPSAVCENCYEFVQRLWRFKEQVDQAQILLTEVCNNILEGLCSAGNVVLSRDNPDVAPAVVVENGNLSVGCEVLGQESEVLGNTEG